MNIGIQWTKTANRENFTSNIGIRVRRWIGRPLRCILRLAIKRKVIIESFPELEKNIPYIFASTHSFDEDIIAGLSCIDRNAYVLLGTTDQIEHNPQMYAAWLNGMIYVDRTDRDSRKSAVEKMVRIINEGSSVLLFPEGTWNNSENKLICPLFAGPYLVAQKTGAEIVPISAFCEPGGNTIYFNAGTPITAEGKTKEEVLSELRDTMATMRFHSIEKHTKPVRRGNLKGDLHERHLEMRRNEYLRVHWTRDVWEEETSEYKDREHPSPDTVWTTFEKVNPTEQNANIMASIFLEIEQIQKYDFVKYMQKHWNERRE